MIFKTKRSPFLKKNYDDRFCKKPIRTEIINLFVNNFCNANCKYCHLSLSGYYSKKGKTEMSLDTLKNILKKVKNSEYINTICFVGAEPTLWKNLNIGIELVKKNGLKAIVATNGLLFKEMWGVNDIEIHLDYRYLKNNTKTLERYIEFSNRNNNYLSVVVVVDNKFSTEDIDFYYDIIKSYNNYIYRISISQVTPDRFDKGGKISVNKAIYLYKKIFLNLRNKQQDWLYFGKPIPYCLIHKENWKFLDKYNIVFAGTCQVGGYEIVIDIDGKTSYPCIGLLNKNFDLSSIENFDNIWELYFDYLDNLRNKMPKEECYNCKWYKEKLCHGGCLDRHCVLYN